MKGNYRSIETPQAGKIERRKPCKGKLMIISSEPKRAEELRASLELFGFTTTKTRAPSILPDLRDPITYANVVVILVPTEASTTERENIEALTLFVCKLERDAGPGKRMTMVVEAQPRILPNGGCSFGRDADVLKNMSFGWRVDNCQVSPFSCVRKDKHKGKCEAA